VSDVVVIIPVYKNYEQRDRCLAALAAQTAPVDAFVHDNTTENIGFTKACNRGLREAHRRGCRFALLINQDCYAEPDAVEKLIAFMEAHPRCAIAGPMQVDANDPDIVGNAGGLAAYPFGRHRGSGRRSQGAFAKDEPITWANGACMFVRMEAVLEFGLMDEGMFLIGSDSDWSFTARQRGWEVWYCAYAVVKHEGGITASPPSLEMTRIFHRDMDYWRRKWAGTVMHRTLDRPANEPRITQPIPHLLHKAWSELQAGRAVDAEVIFRDILEAEPQNVDALNQLGYLAMQHGMVMLAHDYFKHAMDLAPTIALFRMNYANALSNLVARVNDAAAEYREAMRLESRSPEILETIASELARLGHPDDAAAARAKANAIRQAAPWPTGTAVRR
jgi:GT2 family glycosyltransferase